MSWALNYDACKSITNNQAILSSTQTRNHVNKIVCVPLFRRKIFKTFINWLLLELPVVFSLLFLYETCPYSLKLLQNHHAIEIFFAVPIHSLVMHNPSLFARFITVLIFRQSHILFGKFWRLLGSFSPQEKAKIIPNLTHKNIYRKKEIVFSHGHFAPGCRTEKIAHIFRRT